MQNLIGFRSFYYFTGAAAAAAAENAEMYRNNVSGSNYAMQSHQPNLVNGHHHDMQINNFAQSTISNGYGMNLKQEPDVNF